MIIAIWWIRRDLRLSDNQALNTALAQAQQIIPLFIVDPYLLASTYVGDKRLAFLWANLETLATALKTRGSQLIVKHGQPLAVLSDLVVNLGVKAIVAEADYSPYARQRDATIEQTLPLQLVHSLTVHPPATILKADGNPYVVYTPYRKMWYAQPYPSQNDFLPAPDIIPTPQDLITDPYPTQPTLPAAVPFPPGEAEAQHRLSTFTTEVNAPIYHYAEGRNCLDLAGTAQLSPYLRFGLISARQAVIATLQAKTNASTLDAVAGAETWLNELIWREFYITILYHFPHVRQESFQSKYNHLRWLNDKGNFIAWCKGQTGYPVVDAGMRQLQQSGWMHNRARMITASFLVKDLLINWQWGEKWFMQQLIDGDPAANNGGWQWTAGTGTDAAPYFRVFNPILQSKKFDPQGKYIRQWVSELTHVPLKFIHTPWKMPPGLQAEVKCQIGQDYPAPIVNHQQAREATLVAYRLVRDKD